MLARANNLAAEGPEHEFSIAAKATGTAPWFAKHSSLWLDRHVSAVVPRGFFG